MKRILSVLPLLAVVACAEPSPQEPTRPPLPSIERDSCNAAQHGHLIGQDATALERVLLLGPVRVIRPGQAATLDFRTDRINFNIDGLEKITSIHCG